jgi:hypothetical protein
MTGFACASALSIVTRIGTASILLHTLMQGNRIWNFVAFERDSDSAEGSINGIGAEAWMGFGIAFLELLIRALATRSFMICMNFC